MQILDRTQTLALPCCLYEVDWEPHVDASHVVLPSAARMAGHLAATLTVGRFPASQVWRIILPEGAPVS